MSNMMEEQKQQYIGWATENLGNATGGWYAPYLECLGSLLKKFGLGDGFYENFFYYKNFSDFKDIYQRITGESDEDVIQILRGKQKRYSKEFNVKKDAWLHKYAQIEFDSGKRSKPTNFGGIPQLGVILRAYLKFLYYAENPSLTYPKKERKFISVVHLC